MGVHRCTWVCIGVRMGVHRCTWVCIGVRMGVHRCTWVCIGVHGCACIVALHCVTNTCAKSMDVETLLSISSITDLETSCWLPALTPQYPVLVHHRILITVSPEGTSDRGTRDSNHI